MFCVTRAGNSSPNPILFSWELFPEPSLWGDGEREGGQSDISAIPLGSTNCRLGSVDFGKGHGSYRGRSYQPGLQKWAHKNGMTGLSSFIFPSPAGWAPPASSPIAGAQGATLWGRARGTPSPGPPWVVLLASATAR